MQVSLVLSILNIEINARYPSKIISYNPPRYKSNIDTFLFYLISHEELKGYDNNNRVEL